MKKIAFVSVLLVVIMTMTSCLTLLGSLLDDETKSTSTKNSISETTTEIVKERTEKNGYDTSEKTVCVSSGAQIMIPNYFSIGDNSKKSFRWYYAEKSGKTAYITIIEWPGNEYSQSEFEEDISSKKLQNMFIEMSFSSEKYSNSELLDTEYLDICNKKCCVFDYKTVYTDSGTRLNISGSVFFIYIERTDTVLCLMLGQTDNTEYTYNNDFRKVINSIKLLSEDEEKASHTHNYSFSKIEKEATCVDAGEKNILCSICFDSKQETIPATGKHTYTSAITKQATCKDKGEKKYTCSVCGFEYTEVIPVSTNHTYSDWKETKAATTSSMGVRERVCTICGQKQTENIPKLLPVTLPKSSRANNTTKIQKKQTVTLNDYCEFTIESIDITKKVEPPKKSGYYTYYQAFDGKIYVDVCIKFKNLQTQKINAEDALDSYLIFSNIYEYRGSLIAEEDGRSDFTYALITNISPLSTVYLHVLFNASDLIKSSSGSLVAVFEMNGKSYSINIRDGSSETVDTTNGYKAKNSGSIEKGEKIAIPGTCEFYLESITISSEIKPLKATGVYFYKKADEGNKIIDLCFCYKNTSGKRITADDAIKSATMKYNNKYEYSASGFIEEKGRSEFTYLNITNINPLCYEYIHIAFQVPNEVANNAKGSLVTLKINGYNYSVTIK